MRILYLLILLLIFSCKAPLGNKDNSSPARMLEIVEKSKQDKSAIDTTLNNNEGRVLLFAKVTGQDQLVLVDDGEWPDETEYSYNIMRDSTGNILRISSSPVSESGDWDVECVHYFNPKGNTIAYEKRAGAFVLPNDGIAYETITNYFDQQFKPLSRYYKLVDEKDKALDKELYAFDYRGIDTLAYPNATACLKAYNIKP